MTKLAIFIDDPRFYMLAEGQEDSSAAYVDAIRSGIVDLAGDMQDGTIKLVAVHTILTLVPTDSEHD